MFCSFNYFSYPAYNYADCSDNCGCGGCAKEGFCPFSQAPIMARRAVIKIAECVHIQCAKEQANHKYC